ncbi:MAG: YbjN domain-containing protein [Methyloligellaceae bacterium]
MATTEPDYDRVKHPIDIIEKMAVVNSWVYERTAEDELTINVSGSWSDYHLSLNWRDDLEALHLASAFDLRVPKEKLTEMYRLVANINEQLWLGHFDLWAQDGILLYRQSLMLNGAQATGKQCEALLFAALDSCERYYQAFQYVVWAGKTAREALSTAMFETDGRA